MAGRLDPYFSRFKGAGNTAAWLDSNDLQAFSTGGDFSVSAVLAAGTYQIALGAYANLSHADNLGTVSLADGFTALGVPDGLGDASDRMLVSSPAPAPAAWMLALCGLVIAGAYQVKRQVSPETSLPAFDGT